MLCITQKSQMVSMGRLELPRIAPYASETYAYTSSATCPCLYLSLILKKTSSAHLPHKHKVPRRRDVCVLCGHLGSNQGPFEYQSNALPTELCPHERHSSRKISFCTYLKIKGPPTDGLLVAIAYAACRFIFRSLASS